VPVDNSERTLNMSKKVIRVLPHPEVIVASRKDTPEQIPTWKVKSGSSNRGDAFTDFGSRTMRIPTETDETARLIRMHELIHSKVSPTQYEALGEISKNSGIPERLLECAEEWRVNRIVGKMGYDTNLLLDGSEKESGKRIAKTGTPEAYNEALAFALAISGSPKALNALLSGIRSGGQPEWAKNIRNAMNAVKKTVKKDYWFDRELSSTQTTNIYDIDVPVGFTKSLDVANTIMQYRLPVDVYGNSLSDVSTDEGGVEIPVGFGEGVFAPLVFDKTILLNRQVKGHLHRRKRSSTTGKRVLYPSRVLTDPQKRVFGSKVKSNGGVIVFDISGSMDLTDEDIELVLDNAPNAVVMAYSHKKGSTRPNAWILASRGKRCGPVDKLNIGNIGNGVDGPALQWAVKTARRGEPIIWVCDGQVTDALDKGATPEMHELCHRLVDKHNIIQAYNVDHAVKILKNPKVTGKRKVFGRFGRYQESVKPSKYEASRFY
jgi:hypothetical protein